MLPSSFRDIFQRGLSHVQEELSSSLRTLGLAEPSSPVSIPSRQGKHFEGIRLDAGADLLNHYQFQWCRMREASDHNYRMAEQADKAIGLLALYVNQQQTLVNTLLNSLSYIPTLTSQLQKMSHTVELAEKTILETERQLSILDDLVKDAHLEAQIVEANNRALLTIEQKNVAFEKLKGQLMLEHEHKLKEHQVQQMVKAMERQAIFEEAFEFEIKQYKESGVIPRLNLAPRPTASLDEIVVEVDPSSLNQFLDE